MLKVVSPDIVHKTEAGGVVVGLRDEQALREGYDEVLGRVLAAARRHASQASSWAATSHARRELIVGAIHDATFGPTVMVGFGGVFAEALSDVAFRLAPLHRQDGLDMLQELRGARVLAGFRGEPAIDRDQVAGVLVGVGDLLLSHAEIAEIDLNPVAASSDGCVALDVRIVVKD